MALCSNTNLTWNGHLWQMLCFTRGQVNSSKFGTQYFDLAVKPNDIDNSFCDLKAHAPVFNNPFARSLRNYKVLQEADVLTTANIMQRCLRLNPKDRATAEELLQDPWWLEKPSLNLPNMLTL